MTIKKVDPWDVFRINVNSMKTVVLSCGPNELYLGKGFIY